MAHHAATNWSPSIFRLVYRARAPCFSPCRSKMVGASVAPQHGTIRPPFAFTVAIIVLTVAGKIGDAAAPALVGSHPLGLLALNANDLHCGLTSTTVSFLPWLVVALMRRLAEDPLFFLIGWYYRAAALEWVKAWSPDAAEGFTKAEAYFRRASYAAVVVEPGAVVCSLAGAARMSPAVFFSLNIAGTLARLLLIRVLGGLFPEQLELALSVVHSYQRYFLLLAVGLTALATWKMLGWRRKAKAQ